MCFPPAFNSDVILIGELSWHQGFQNILRRMFAIGFPQIMYVIKNYWSLYFHQNLVDLLPLHNRKISPIAQHRSVKLSCKGNLSSTIVVRIRESDVDCVQDRFHGNIVFQANTPGTQPGTHTTQLCLTENLANQGNFTYISLSSALVWDLALYMACTSWF